MKNTKKNKIKKYGNSLDFFLSIFKFAINKTSKLGFIVSLTKYNICIEFMKNMS